MESRDLVVDQVIVEYQAYCTGQLSERLGTTEAPDGAVEYCGDEDDPAHWAICYVRASDGVVRPLVVGHRERILAEFSAMDRRGMPFWDALLFPPPVAVIGGHEYPFKAARGSHLLGVVKLDRQAVLLAAADDRLVAVLVHDGVATTFPLGRPGALREVDVDLMRSFSRPTTTATTKPPDDPLRPSPRTKAHHIRIVPGRRVELGGGPTVAEVLEAAFAHIEARATTPPKKPQCRKKPADVGKATSPAAATAPKRPTLIGKKAAPYVLGYLRRMALRGCGDLVGLTGDIIRAIQVYFKDFKITGEAFADALKRISETGTCLIGPRDSGDRIWEIKLAGLNDPTSAHHLRLCRETRSRVRLEEAAANQQGAAPMTSKGQTSGEDSDKAAAADTHAGPAAAMDGSSHARDPSVEGPGDAAATSDANESASPGERSTPPDPDVHAQHPGSAAAPAPATTIPADRPTAEVVPACRSSATAAQAEAIDLVAQLDMNPIGWFMLLLWCLMQMVEPDAAAASDGGEGVENDEPRAEGEPTPTAASDGVVHVECASPGDDAVASIEAQVRGDAPDCVGQMLNLYRSLWRWARPRQRYVALRTSLLEAPTLHRHHAFAPVQPEPRSRALGARGPRGPPHAPRLTQPNDVCSAAVCRGRR